MPGIKTRELLDVLSNGDFHSIQLKGLQNGSFVMMIERRSGFFYHENSNGVIKEYPKVDNALIWVKRKSTVKAVLVDIEIWQDDLRKR